jgi:hypothetical protein
LQKNGSRVIDRSANVRIDVIVELNGPGTGEGGAIGEGVAGGKLKDGRAAGAKGPAPFPETVIPRIPLFDVTEPVFITRY